jgi:hypothetical protein
MSIVLALALGGCGTAALPPNEATVDASTTVDVPAPLDVTGSYSCVFQAVDDQVTCGGAVYRSHLMGTAVPLTATQSGRSLQLGAWGVIMDGTLGSANSVEVGSRDTRCTGCDVSRPAVLEFRGTAATGQIRDIRVRLYQIGSGYSDCEKTYSGVCARN